MFEIIRYIDQLGVGVWSVVAEASSKEEAEFARDFFEANWPWEDTGVEGRIHYSYEVRRAS